VPVVFLHGLETGPHGSKYQALRRLFPELMAPDCEGVLDIEQRLGIIERELRGRSQLVLVGSSFGGLAAVLFASRHPELVAGAVLCAPAVHRLDLLQLGALPAETVIIHGRRDEIVPLAASEALVARFPFVRLLAVDDEHRLADSLELLGREVVAMVQRLERQGRVARASASGA
jgi:pimeloyl-ACP methyl ester carboxylesterase